MTDLALNFPIQIGLVGAPGSHKAEVAERFRELSEEWFESHETGIEIIQNPGSLLEDNDIAMGVFGGFSDDVRAFYLNYEAEEECRANDVSFITLGTGLANLAHAGVHLENVLSGVQTPATEMRLKQGQVTMSLLTFLYLEGFKYMFGFYIPHPGSTVVLPGATEDNYGQRVDNALRTIFGNFGVRIQMLDQPTVEEQAQEMFDTVKRIMEEGPPEASVEEDPESDPEFEPGAGSEEVPPVEEATLTE